VMRQNERRGNELKVDHLSLLLFADNCFISATSVAMLIQMMTACHDIISKYAVVVRHDECYWITAASATSQMK
ncbi:unnamed protein product, partial [Prorocentrum cordatum]